MLGQSQKKPIWARSPLGAAGQGLSHSNLLDFCHSRTWGRSIIYVAGLIGFKVKDKINHKRIIYLAGLFGGHGW